MRKIKNLVFGALCLIVLGWVVVLVSCTLYQYGYGGCPEISLNAMFSLIKVGLAASGIGIFITLFTLEVRR